MAARFEYMVVELRERLWGGAQAGRELQKILNENARDGWQLRTITKADVKGRVGRGAVEGLIITFERPAS